MDSSQNNKEFETQEVGLSRDFNKPEPVLQNQKQEPLADIYYGVFISNNHMLENEDVKKVYTNKNECLNVLKKYQGARFKGFPSHDEAICFSEYGPIVSTPCSSTDSHNEQPGACSTVGEKPSPFRGPRSQELVKFRKSIEKGNMEYFDECIKSNPRFLVSSGDTPSILQEGSRYNALHIACRNDKPELCSKILSIICKVEFFQKLYPDDTVESSNRRSEFLLDLYLNMPDKGLNETPLHFACKHGSLECAQVLVRFPICDRERLNKYSERPREIICSRLSKPDKNLSAKLNELFEEQLYVPVLRDEDNCLAPVIGTPWSPLDKDALSLPLFHSSPEVPSSPVSPLFKVRGYAGPMSPQKANSFYGRWKKGVVPSPIRNQKGKIATIRVADHEKGMERFGRDLATEFDVDWAEYWDFLGGFVTFSSKEGLQKLEEHLKFKYREVLKVRNLEESNNTLNLLESKFTAYGNLDSTQPNDNHEGEVSRNFNETQSTLSSIGGLCQELEALRLNMLLSPDQITDCQTKSNTIASLKRKLSQSKSNFCSKKPVLIKPYGSFSQTPTSASNKNTSSISNNNYEANISELSSFKDNSNLEDEQYNFAIQSTRISSQRLSSFLGETALSISSHVGPDMQIARKLRNKVKPELESLRKVLSRCFNLSSEEKLDFGFIHMFLAAKTIEHLLENVSASNLFLISETLKLIVANIASFDDSSSDEEDNLETCVDDLERKEVLAHFHCVTRRLERACMLGIELIKDGKEDAKIDLSELEDCECNWTILNTTDILNNSMRFYPVNTGPINDIINNNKSDKRKKERSGRFHKAHSFVSRILFGKKEEEKEKEESPLVIPLFESLRKTSLINKEDKGDEQEEEAEDSESFASAVSSFEGDSELATPEQEIKTFINGCEPTKDDFHVFVAIEEMNIDEDQFPYVFRWMRLVESYSRETRERWPLFYGQRLNDTTFPTPNLVHAKKQLLL